MNLFECVIDKHPSAAECLHSARLWLKHPACERVSWHWLLRWAQLKAGDA